MGQFWSCTVVFSFFRDTIPKSVKKLSTILLNNTLHRTLLHANDHVAIIVYSDSERRKYSFMSLNALKNTTLSWFRPHTMRVHILKTATSWWSNRDDVAQNRKTILPWFLRNIARYVLYLRILTQIPTLFKKKSTARTTPERLLLFPFVATGSLNFLIVSYRLVSFVRCV